MKRRLVLLVAGFSIALALPTAAPAVVQVELAGVSHIEPTKATFEGCVGIQSEADEANPNDPPTVFYFEYGPTTSYGERLTQPLIKNRPSGGVDGCYSGAGVNATAMGLAPGKTYHYRLVAESRMSVSKGLDKTFTTPLSGVLVGAPIYGPSAPRSSEPVNSNLAIKDAVILKTKKSLRVLGTCDFVAYTSPFSLTYNPGSGGRTLTSSFVCSKSGTWSVRLKIGKRRGGLVTVAYKGDSAVRNASDTRRVSR